MKKFLIIPVLGLLWCSAGFAAVSFDDITTRSDDDQIESTEEDADNNAILSDGFYEFHWSYKNKNKMEYLVFDIVKIENGKLEHMNIPCHRGIKGKYRKNLKYKLSNNGKKFSVSGIVNMWGDDEDSKINIIFNKDKIKELDINKKPLTLEAFSKYGNFKTEEIYLRIQKTSQDDADSFICVSTIVKFNSYSPISAKEMLGGLEKIKKQEVYGNLYYPKTSKKEVPLIITMHPSMGFVPDHHFKFFNDLGIAVLDVQTFKSRGINDQWEYIVSEEAATIDAYAALDKISKDSRIDKDKIAVMGFSYGAMAVINTHQKFFIDIIKPKNRFIAHIAYYPLCYLYKDIETADAPLYIFIGEKDRLTPYEYCEDYSERVKEGGGTVILKVFPKATHRFEWEQLKNPIVISTFGEHKKEFVLKKLDPSYPRYNIGEGVSDITEPNGWSYFSLESEGFRKKLYDECCEERSMLRYNNNAATESKEMIKNIFNIE